MRDPVTGFEYPERWVEACTDENDLLQAESGFGVLTSSGKVLRRGLTTGTTAAAACKAAVLSLLSPLSTVAVRLPCGLAAVLPVEAEGGRAVARKDPGDYRDDITGGLAFEATAVETGEGIVFVAGPGIGRFIRDTPRYAKGDPAVSATAGWCIENAIREAVEETGIAGARVTLAIPRGAEIGAQTLNPRVGVEGGISVLGSTGLVEPWDDHLTESAFARIAGADRVVLTTGRLGLRYSRMLFPGHEVVLVGKHLRRGLEAARGEVILCGLPALILKFIDPSILEDTGHATVEELAVSPHFSAIVEGALRTFRERFPGARVVIVDREGGIVGDSG
ncbi:MAG: cobalt-precorrin-5B (C(1))-methyltransferase [Methanomicrobiaceae archaeon]|nr:cobalt-precorrin-5B (C(1))-methyltransferase [Methanomicrobiaceae archaeon]